MRVVIVEDEQLAQTNLKNIILKRFDDLEIVGMLSSVKSAIKWLRDPENHADIIFLDVELSDGMCFDIFQEVKTKAKVIITTAYDTYAIKAFKINSIDYLLKPIDPEELQEAVERCRAAIDDAQRLDVEALRKALATEPHREPRSRFVLRIGDRILILPIEEVAYLYAEDKSTFAVTKEGKRHMLDMTLDAIQESVDPARFFRISRSQIVALDAIESVSKHLNNRLKVNLIPKPSFEAFVSRFRINDFLDWLEGR